MIRFTLPNGMIWKGSKEEVSKSIGLYAFQKHQILETIKKAEEAMLEVNEIHYRDGSILELECPTVQEEINRGGF
jgi:hypothetical protein